MIGGAAATSAAIAIEGSIWGCLGRGKWRVSVCEPQESGNRECEHTSNARVIICLVFM
jgi:hypothetical protein